MRWWLLAGGIVTLGLVAWAVRILWLAMLDARLERLRDDIRRELYD